jgi:hypothetical protein
LNKLAEFFSDFTTLSEKTTFILALLGFLLSVASLIRTAATQRRKLDLEIYAVKAYSSVIFLRMSFINKSRLPLLITRIALIQDESTIECTAVPRKVASHNGRDEYSKALPIQLHELGGDNGTIVFEHVQAQLEDSATQLTLLIGTNRGRATKMTLALPTEWFLHRRAR